MFRDNIAALLVAATRQRKDNPNKVAIEQRAYRCKFCKQWHLTSKPFIRKDE